jgi:UDP-N-acetylglucosamine 4,6-dehydratase
LIPEAAQLVIQAGAMAESGQVFVLDMGEPIKILTLARTMIELAGLTIKSIENTDGDIEISFIGLKEGEKLFEELEIGNDLVPTSNSRILVAREFYLPWKEIEKHLSFLQDTANASTYKETLFRLQEIAHMRDAS